jgi:hypothetical protein
MVFDVVSGYCETSVVVASDGFVMMNDVTTSPLSVLLLLTWLVFDVGVDFMNSCLLCSAQECDNAAVMLPQVIVSGELVVIGEGSARFPKHSGSYPPGAHDDVADESVDSLEYYILNSDKPVLYVRNFLNHSVAEDLKAFCLEGQRFVRSSIGGKSSSSGTTTGAAADDPTRTRGVQQHEIRTSESCNMVPAAVYRSSAQVRALFAQDPLPSHVARVKEEVDLSWLVAKRAAGLLRVDPSTVEPLQLVRYTSPDAEYKLHHDRECGTNDGFVGVGDVVPTFSTNFWWRCIFAVLSL